MLVEQPQRDGLVKILHPDRPWSLTWDPAKKRFRGGLTTEVFTVQIVPWLGPTHFYRATLNNPTGHPDGATGLDWVETVIDQITPRVFREREVGLAGAATRVKAWIRGGAPAVGFYNVDAGIMPCRLLHSDEWFAQPQEGCGMWWVAVQQYAATHFPTDR